MHSVTGWIIPALVGAATGVLSGFGVGGGTLLLVYLTTLGGMELRQAQGVNLLYFLITAPPALWGHFKNGLVDKGLALRAGAAGLAAAALSAWLAGGLDGTLLRKAFGVFTMVVGLRELFCKSGRQD